MEADRLVERLFNPDNQAAYAALLELEAFSAQSDVLYPYLDKFLGMIHSNQYVLRVRGFRLACKQARWDGEKRIDGAIGDILAALNDEKPTAVRQALKALEEIATYKPELSGKVRAAVEAMDCSKYKDSMQGLILKDMRGLLNRLP